jgi:hypothetical protein
MVSPSACLTERSFFVIQWQLQCCIAFQHCAAEEMPLGKRLFGYSQLLRHKPAEVRSVDDSELLLASSVSLSLVKKQAQLRLNAFSNPQLSKLHLDL